MSRLEKSVQDLTVALEELSARVERQILSTVENSDSILTTQNQATAAQKHANKAALGLASTIDDIKRLISTVEESIREENT